MMLLLLNFFLPAPGIYGQTPARSATAQAAAPGVPQTAETKTAPPVAGVGDEAAGVDELVNILVKKGVLKQEDVTAAMQKKGEPGSTPLGILTELLKNKGVITSGDADKVAKSAEAGAAAKPVVLYTERDQKEMEKMTKQMTQDLIKKDREKLKTEVKDEVLDETRKEIQSAAAPEWTKRIRFGGDIRLRYEGDYFGNNNATFLDPNNPSQTLNSTTERDRLLVRARLGATADVNDVTEVGVRLSTGNTTNPVTVNQTMGTYENKWSVVLDLAYLKIKPLPGLTLWGGRIPNPFFYSNLVWYDDLTFDSVLASYTRPLTERLSVFTSAGVFPIQELEFSTKDKWLYAGQLGLEYKPMDGLTGKLGATYYYYENLQGVPINPLNPNSWQQYTAAPFLSKGNTVFNINPLATSPAQYQLALASNFHELNLTGRLDIAFWQPVHVVFLADYVNNLGFDRSQVATLTGNPYVKETNQGYQVGVSVGHPIMNRFKDWRLYAYYKYLEADAVVAAFTDPDFHLGGTNAKGWYFGGELGLAKNLWLSAKWYTTNQIDGPPLAIDSLFVDVNARF
ncbi:MAG TPA: putative porin [Syntrophorhabdales bacterium]|nr:putative porin [Syntrophorhabdales bacterium]